MGQTKVARYREDAASYILLETPINKDVSLLNTVALIRNECKKVIASLTTKLEAMVQKRHSNLLRFNSITFRMEIFLNQFQLHIEENKTRDRNIQKELTAIKGDIRFTVPTGILTPTQTPSAPAAVPQGPPPPPLTPPTQN